MPPKRNAIRHGFLSHLFALCKKENLTALLASNSPDMLHEHYKALVSEKQARAWFDLRPQAPSNVVQLEAGATS